MPAFIFNEKIKINKVKDILIDVFCFFVFLMALFVFLPSQVYYNNVDEYSYFFYEYLVYALLVVIISMILFSILASFLNERIRIIISVLIVTITLLFMVQTNFLNWNYGLLDGSKIDWKGHIWNGIVDTLLWCGAVLIALLFKNKVYKRYLKVTALFLFLFQLTSILYFALNYNLSDNSKNDYLKNHYADISSTFSFSREDNVLIILLDTYRSDIFNEIINEDRFYRDIFKDFVYYRNNIGGYPTSYPSIPLLMTGKYYTNTMPIMEYISKEYISNSLPKTFLQKGYDISLPYNKMFYTGPEISNNYIKKTYNIWKMINESRSINLNSVVFFKCMPTFLKPNFVEKAQFHNGDLDFLSKFKKTFSCDNKKNTFKFFHLLGAHPPFTIDENMNMKLMPYNRESYKAQAKADLKICADIFEYMKRNKIFNNSLIVVMADHGFRAYGMTNTLTGEKTENQVIKSAIPLMLVKERKSNHSIIRISDQPITNADLKKIVMEEPMSKFKDDRKYYFYDWTQDYWHNDYLPPMSEYRVSGHAWSEESWNPTGKMYTKQGVVKKNFLRYNSDIVFNKNNIPEFMSGGWSSIENDLCWTNGKESILIFLCDDEVKQDIKMVSTVSPFLVPGKIESQEVDVYANEIKIGRWHLKSGMQSLKNTIPLKCLNDGIVKIKFKISNPASPAQYGISDDKRMLGVAFNKIRFNVVPLYEYGKDILFAEAASESYLVSGWSEPEGVFRWSDGKESYIKIPVKNITGRMRIIMTINPLIYGILTKQRVKCIVNNTYFRDLVIDKTGDYSIAMDNITISNNLLDLKMQYTDNASPADLGLNDDKRILAVGLSRIKIEVK